MAQAKKGLGRGLAALIPTDMDFLAEVARGDFSVLATPSPARQDVSRETELDSVGTRVPQPPQVLEAGTDASPAATPLGEGSGQRTPSRRGLTAEELFGGRDTWGQDASSAVRWVAPSSISTNPYQPRRTFDEGELSSLAESIQEHGVLQPILVRPIALGPAFREEGEQAPGIYYQLIAGERRWRASQRAGLERVPIIVREVSDQQALELAIIENVQRHDISALDAAIAYKRLAQEFGLSQESIARRVGKSRSSVANTMRLLDLPPEAQEAIQDGAITEGHGRAILLAPGDGARRAALRATLRGKLSVRQTEELAGRIARQARRDAAASDAGPSVAEPGLLATQAPLPRQEPEVESLILHDEDTLLEEELQRALSCQVQIKRRKAGGQIVLFASDAEQLHRLTQALSRATT